jgi:predicted RNA-binding Zn-ribbon protein involved in translation (DUF1610 family)
MKELIPVSHITLLWICPDCDEKVEGALSDIVDVGTAICPDCGEDMVLDDNVEVAPDFG